MKLAIPVSRLNLIRLLLGGKNKLSAIVYQTFADGQYNFTVQKSPMKGKQYPNDYVENVIKLTIEDVY